VFNLASSFFGNVSNVTVSIHSGKFNYSKVVSTVEKSYLQHELLQAPLAILTLCSLQYMTLQENYKHSTLNIKLFWLRTITTTSTNHPTITKNATLQYVRTGGVFQSLRPRPPRQNQHHHDHRLHHCPLTSNLCVQL
jgi:hypothetical protein